MLVAWAPVNLTWTGGFKWVLTMRSGGISRAELLVRLYNHQGSHSNQRWFYLYHYGAGGEIFLTEITWVSCIIMRSTLWMYPGATVFHRSKWLLLISLYSRRVLTLTHWFHPASQTATVLPFLIIIFFFFHKLTSDHAVSATLSFPTSWKKKRVYTLCPPASLGITLITSHLLSVYSLILWVLTVRLRFFSYRREITIHSPSCRSCLDTA